MKPMDPRDLQRKRFQAVAAVTLDKQAEAIHLTREYLADLAGRVDALEAARAADVALTRWGRVRRLLRGQ